MLLSAGMHGTKVARMFQFWTKCRRRVLIMGMSLVFGGDERR
jgi:hypothetical protein